MDENVERRELAGARGSSLVETLLAAAVLASGIVSIAQLFSVATTSNLSARRGTVATVLAEQKLEQLRALSWALDSGGMPVSDLSTDTSTTPEAAGGTGLQVSPATALRQNTAGFVDHVGADGEVVGRSVQPPPRALFTRRWSIEPVSADPNGALIIQVLVTPRGDRDTVDRDPAVRLPGEAPLMTVKARRPQ